KQRCRYLAGRSKGGKSRRWLLKIFPVFTMSEEPVIIDRLFLYHRKVILCDGYQMAEETTS
ncbi:MAG: hypothetical protein LT105_08975, partial [Lentimicrobium sp.]|nr:hypothetical protein [Lentimicrobium sp.]